MTRQFVMEEIKPQLPRKRPRKLMHVIDAGQDMIHMKCWHCGYDDGETTMRTTVTEAKRGYPCPECNRTNLA